MKYFSKGCKKLQSLVFLWSGLVFWLLGKADQLQLQLKSLGIKKPDQTRLPNTSCPTPWQIHYHAEGAYCCLVAQIESLINLRQLSYSPLGILSFIVCILSSGSANCGALDAWCHLAAKVAVYHVVQQWNSATILQWLYIMIGLQLLIKCHLSELLQLKNTQGLHVSQYQLDVFLTSRAHWLLHKYLRFKQFF